MSKNEGIKPEVARKFVALKMCFVWGGECWERVSWGVQEQINQNMHQQRHKLSVLLVGRLMLLDTEVL